MWGTGEPEREFLHVNDLAEAIYFCLSRKINHTFVNVGGADRIKIKELQKHLN